jgi:O-antigen/teichoic acid export membrane protein
VSRPQRSLAVPFISFHFPFSVSEFMSFLLTWINRL